MARTGFITGSIFEFKVPLNLGFSYCKIFDFREKREFDGLLVKVYDYQTVGSLKDVSVLSDKDWLYGARRMPNLPSTRGKGAWKSKGVLVEQRDSIIPDFKYSSKMLELLPEQDDSKISTMWFAIKNIADHGIPCSHEQIKHLEDTAVNSQKGIEIRTAMEYLRKEGKDVSKYFDLQSSLIEGITYRQMINVPRYDTITSEIRDKAQC